MINCVFLLQLNGRYYQQTQGIPQGSKLSTMLCGYVGMWYILFELHIKLATILFCHSGGGCGGWGWVDSWK